MKGMIYDNANIFNNDVQIQSYINQIAEDTGAVIIIITEDKYENFTNALAEIVEKNINKNNFNRIVKKPEVDKIWF